jgi:hypothetical protein
MIGRYSLRLVAAGAGSCGVAFVTPRNRSALLTLIGTNHYANTKP